MIKISNVKMIEVSDWDRLVQETYKKYYSFQQQDGCKSRGTHDITIPYEETYDYLNDSLPEEINGGDMGVSFKSWLGRDIEEWNGKEKDKNFIYLFWGRNFYPDLQTVANDLHKKGLIEAGNYTIKIDW